MLKTEFYSAMEHFYAEGALILGATKTHVFGAASDGRPVSWDLVAFCSKFEKCGNPLTSFIAEAQNHFGIKSLRETGSLTAADFINFWDMAQESLPGFKGVKFPLSAKFYSVFAEKQGLKVKGIINETP